MIHIEAVVETFYTLFYKGPESRRLRLNDEETLEVRHGTEEKYQ
jgi:hypothetical protein